MRATVFAVFLAGLSLCLGFVAPMAPASAQLRASSFAPREAAVAVLPEAGRASRGARGMTMMGGKVAKFGVFSPAVIIAKIVLGEQKLNKIRGKAIALHSQAITEFCYFVGAQGKMRNRIIKKAKTNGDDLGFLW